MRMREAKEKIPLPTFHICFYMLFRMGFIDLDDALPPPLYCIRVAEKLLSAHFLTYLLYIYTHTRLMVTGDLFENVYHIVFTPLKPEDLLRNPVSDVRVRLGYALGYARVCVCR
jgi:hypothetical protein